MARWDVSFLRLVRGLPQSLLTLHDRIEQAGFEVDIVGGCVRDLLLGKMPKDYDLATSATPKQLQEVLRPLEGVGFVDLGSAFGTLGVCYQGLVFEITTFREESHYNDHRHPSALNFVKSLEIDLKRRDFTINAFALHPKKGLLDLHGGLHDLATNKLRLVGAPAARLQEDALRILRALRFASVLGFAIEPATKEALWAQAPLLAHIAQERIREEFFKLLLGDFAAHVCVSFQPLLENALQARFTHLDQLDKLPPNLRARLLLLCQSWEIQTLQDFCVRLKFSKKLRQSLRKLHAHIPLKLPSKNPRLWLKRHLQALHLGELRALLGFLQAQDPFLGARLRLELKTLLKTHEVYSLRYLDLKGTDLLDWGFQGVQVGALLKQCLEAVISGAVCNEKEALLEWVKDTKEQETPS